MGTLKVNGNIDAATNTISAASFLGNNATIDKLLSASSYKTGREIMAAPEGTAAGWYRCALLSYSKGSSNNFILSIRRSYYSPANEGYIFSISHDYQNVNISQLSGSTGGHLLTKIRVNFDENGNIYIDYYMNSNGVASYKNTWYISGWGDGEVFAPYLVSSYTGSVTEFATVIGISNNNGFKGNADTATKLATARTISLTGSVTGSGSFDGSGNLSISTTTNHTHAYLPLSGGTMTGAITLHTTGLYTPNIGGYYTDEYGNFIHQTTTTTNCWTIFNKAKTKSLQYFFETGELTVPGAITATSFSGNLSGNASTSNLPAGFTIRHTSSTWGAISSNNHTLVTGWATNDDASIDFLCYPNRTELSVKIDGFFFQNEGQYRCFDTSGGTLADGASLQFTGTSASVSAGIPTALSYGRLQAYGTLCINADTDSSGSEYVLLTAGKGLSSNNNDGLAIGQSTLTWQGATVLTSSNFPSSGSLARLTDIWISASSLDVNTYYPVVISLPYQGLCRIKLAVQLNSGTKPSWSTHNGGFTSNIDVEIIAAGWGTVSSNRYLLRQDDWNFSNVKPAYFAGQLGNASLAVFYVRGGGSYRFMCDWQDASISLRTSSTTYNSQTVEPTTSTSIFHSGSKSHLYCNVDYASSAGNADTLDGYNHDSFAKIATPNNLMHSGNEFTFAPAAYNGSVWFNYRTAGGSTNGNISQYIFGNGKGGLAPIEHSYDITHNYGTYDPNSQSPPGTGTAGAIYYKIVG